MRVCKNDDRNAFMRFAALLLVLGLSCLPLAAIADGIFIRSASTKLIDNVYRLDAQVDYRFSEQVLEALHNGVTITVLIEFEVMRQREYVWDTEVAKINQRYQLSYHALSQKYQIHNINSGSVFNFHSLQTAITLLGTISSLPVLEGDILNPRSTYYARLRASLATDALPTPLRLLSYVMPGWTLSSEWYAWPLKD